MAGKTYQLVIFDFDGTLVDSKEVIGEATNRALEDCGYPRLDVQQIYHLIGLPLVHSLRVFLGEAASEDDVERVFERYRHHWYDLEPGNIHLFPDVREMLDALHVQGLEMAIATSKSLKGLDRLLDTLDLRKYFGFWITNDMVATGKPHPEMVERALAHFSRTPGEAVMVGDTIYDLRMGRAARVDTCAVTYGSHSAAQLAGESPDYLVGSAAELRQVLLGG